MFTLTRVIGSLCAIYDSDDGSLEWVSKEKAHEYNKEVSIYGMNAGKFEPVSTLVEPKDCNWNGKNVFETAIRFTADNNWNFILTVEGGKKYKGIISADMLCFNNGIYLMLSESMQKYVYDRDWDSVLARLRNLEL